MNETLSIPAPYIPPPSDRINRSEIRSENCPTEFFGLKIGRTLANIYLVEGMAVRSENCDQIISVTVIRSEIGPLFVVDLGHCLRLNLSPLATGVSPGLQSCMPNL